MPRKPRFFLPEVPVHIVQRGHSQESVFFEDDDYCAYVSWLAEAAERYGCAIHAYVLMHNHVHILATPQSKDGVTRMMQYLGRQYVPYVNYHYGGSGSLWEGRYKASLVQDKGYLLSCMRYIELNPVRAEEVRSPNHYRWSSYRANAQGKADELIQMHAEYRKLGRSQAARCKAYRELFKTKFDSTILSEIRDALQTGTPLGTDDFREQVEKTLNCKVGYSKRGRPRKLVLEVC